MEKRVLLITSTFPRSEKDEQIPWMGELVRRLKSEGIKIDVLAPAFRASPNHTYFGLPVYRFRYAPASWEVLTHDEGAIFKLRQKPWLFFLAIFYLFFGIIATIKKTRRTDYDVIHVHWPFPQGIFGVVAKWLTPAKLILTFYGAEFTLANRIPFGKAILRFQLKQADKVVAISNFTKKRILEIAKVSVTLIPFSLGISKSNLKSQPSKKIGSKSKRVLFVGRLIERKGVTYLIKAIANILATMAVRLDIVGDGPLLSQLKQQIKKTHLQKNVFLHGKISEKRLIAFYQNCDAFVLPAIVDQWGDTEGLGVVLLEAMNFKKPVVASRVGGITDIVKNNQTGLLVPQKDSGSLAKAITKILTDRKFSKKLAQKGHQFLQEKFGWEKIIAQTIKIYSLKSDRF